MPSNSNIPLLTVGMPVYNAASTLTYALDTLLAQTFKDFQIIISDNASTDETREICERYQEKDKRILYIRNEQNMGLLYNFNRFLEIAESPLFMWAAHDDQWKPDFMKELVGLLMSNPTASLAFCAFDYLCDPVVGNKIKGANLRLCVLGKCRTPFSRLALYLLLPETIRKAAMVYAIMRLELLKSIGGYFSFFNKKKGIQEDLMTSDHHTIFLLGLRGGFAISDRTLFLKGIRIPEIGAPAEYPLITISEMLTSNHFYRVNIAHSGLPTSQRLILHLCALINITVGIGARLVHRTLESILARMNLLFFAKRIRRSIRTSIRGRIS